MFKALSDFLKSKEYLLERREPIVSDTHQFFKRNKHAICNTITGITYNQGIVTVSVSSSVAVQELFFSKQDLIVFLKEKKYPVRDIFICMTAQE